MTGFQAGGPGRGVASRPSVVPGPPRAAHAPPPLSVGLLLFLNSFPPNLARHEGCSSSNPAKLPRGSKIPFGRPPPPPPTHGNTRFKSRERSATPPLPLTTECANEKGGGRSRRQRCRRHYPLFLRCTDVAVVLASRSIAAYWCIHLTQENGDRTARRNLPQHRNQW